MDVTVDDKLCELLSEIGYDGNIVIYDILNWFIYDKKLYPEIIVYSTQKNLWVYRVSNEYGHSFTDISNKKYKYNEAIYECILHMIKILKK